MHFKDYFLAEGSLTWWAIGASLIASNISAEQFIGTSGSAFKMGLAISTYEWMAAITLIIVAVFLSRYILKTRYLPCRSFCISGITHGAMVMAIFWLSCCYIVVNLMSILYLALGYQWYDLV